MKRIILLLVLAFSILNSQFSISFAQGWKELMDSSKFYSQRNELSTALNLGLKSYELAKNELGGIDSNVAVIAQNISNIYISLVKFDTALIYSRLDSSIIVQIRGKNNIHYIKTAQSLGRIYTELNKFDLSVLILEESLGIIRRLTNENDSNITDIAVLLTYCFWRNGKFDSALVYARLDSSVTVRNFGKESFRYANTTINLGAQYIGLGQFDLAEKSYSESLEINRKISKGDNPILASSINNLACYYDERGNFGASEPLHKEALEIRRRLYKNDHPDLATSINNMATFYAATGNYAEAETLFMESLEMNRRMYKDGHPSLINTINNLANIYRDIGKYVSAESLFKEVLEMNRRIFKGDHPLLASSIDNLGKLYSITGNYIAAEPLLKESLSMRRRIYKVDHPLLTISIFNLAFFYNLSGNFTPAVPLYNEAIAMSERVYKSDNPYYAYSLVGLADIYCKLGYPDSAKPLFDKVFEMTIKKVQEYFPYLDEQQKIYFWANNMENRINKYYKFGSKYYLQRPEIAEKMTDITLATKGIVLNSTQKSLSKARFVKRILEDWQNTRQLWLRLVQNPQKAKRMGINIDSVGKVASELEKEISLQSADFKKAFDTSLVRWKDVQKTLNQNEAAIEIIRIRENRDTTSYVALITRKDSKVPELVLLNNEKKLEVECLKKYLILIEKQRKGSKLSKENLGELGFLFNEFWKPILEKLYAIKTAYVSMDGVYNKFNLNTLINPETGKYVIEELDLRIVTSTRDLANKMTKSEKGIVNSGENNLAILFGDPKFELKKEVNLPASNSEISHGTRSYYLGGILEYVVRRGIAPLPGTKIEIKKISNNLESKNWKVKNYTGDAALEENIKTTVNPKILHIATHGIFLKDVEYLTREQDFESKRYIENPLIRSMLLFAGSENTIKGETSGSLDKDDGILTAFEVMNLDLDNTELVVLSACETGLGEARNGEGVYGLQRAFQVAGAKSLVMSLWNVNDQATQELMTNFYTGWLNGMSKREAFRQAQLELMKKYPGFYYWGAFVMVGE